jgi:hypothetical protein
LTPGDYLFEDFGNAFTIIAQRSGEAVILLSFPIATSMVWVHQGVFSNGVSRPLQLIDHLEQCYLPCFVSRGPRVGGFLHPSCYGIPGANDTTKASRQAFYVPTTVFDGDGLIITSSYAAAYYRGRAASFLSRGGIANPVRAFATQAAAKAFFRNTAPQTVVLPSVVPYIQSQLEHLDLFDDTDGGPSPYDPITAGTTIVGRNTPALYKFDGDLRTTDVWKPSPPPTPYIPVDSTCHPDDLDSTISTTASTASISTSSSTYSSSEERERSKDRMTDLKISPLPTSGDALREWVLTLKWSLAGDCWCHDGTHATDITVTTPSTKSLSNDLMSVLKKAVTEHTTTANLRNARSLLQDNINGVDGTALISQGKGFEMYHLRIKSGFSRGLGTEAITHLTEYVSATQNSLESIGSFFDRMTQLYDQVQQTKGCSIGETAQKSFLLEGLRRGAYSSVLGTWVKKILISQGRLTLSTATMSDLQHGATDLLATSIYYKGNVLLAGRTTPPPPCPAARAATDSRGDSRTDDTSSPPTGQLAAIVKCIGGGHSLNQAQTAWLRNRFKCVHCFSNAHTLDDCRAASSKWTIKAIPGATAICDFLRREDELMTELMNHKRSTSY